MITLSQSDASTHLEEGDLAGRGGEPEEELQGEEADAERLHEGQLGVVNRFILDKEVSIL